MDPIKKRADTAASKQDDPHGSEEIASVCSPCKMP